MSRKCNVKGRPFPGAKISDMYHHLIPLLKSDSHLLPKKIFFICFNDSPSKMMKDAFYFTLKALFVFKIFKFLS